MQTSHPQSSNENRARTDPPTTVEIRSAQDNDASRRWQDPTTRVPTPHDHERNGF